MRLIIASLALNETRAPFRPTLWTLAADNQTTTLKQVWFAGAHSSVGGSDPNHGLSDISLAWMAQQLTHYTDLEYDIQYLLDSRGTFGVNQMNTPWGTEAWTDPYKGVYKFGGYLPRTPGKYAVNTGERTHEYIHKSVLTRIEALGNEYAHPDISELQETEFGAVEEKLRWP
jgi:Uncharacterized alpha/beta hydrolase domain (DUF2235)